MPGRPIEEVRRELGLRHVVKLASNESPYPLSPAVRKAIARAAESVNRYPDGGCYYLRQALARRLKVDPRQFIFGNGSDELIVLAARALVKAGDEVVLAKPSFLIYSIASRIAGAKLREIPLNNFHYDLPAMQKAVTKKTRIVFLGNPDNPAGTYLTQAGVEGLLKNIPSDVLVFVDEAYFEYVHAGDYADSPGLLKKYPNVMVTRTFSKMYGLAGLRIGYGMARVELIDYLDRLREPFNVNAVAQAAALACLKDQAYYRRLAADVEVQKQYLYRELARMGIRHEISCANFVLVASPLPATEMTRKLTRLGVIVRDMTFWGMEGYVRVSIGAAAENKKFVRALEKCLKK